MRNSEKSFKRLKAPNFSNFEWIAYQSGDEWAPWAALVIKNPPANAEDIREMGQTLGGEDPWKRAWQPTPVFFPGEYNGQRSLLGYSS